jgi:hypothetical protein
MAVAKTESKEKKKKSLQLAKGSAKTLGYGLILVFLLIWVFALGVLTGRGDVNRWLQRLGLYKTELAARLGVAPPAEPTAPPAVLPTGEGSKAPAAALKAVEEGAKPPAPAENPAAAKPPSEAAPPAAGLSGPKTGSESQTEAKKGKTPGKLENKEKIAEKLAFQNALDGTTRKPGKGGAKKDKTKDIRTASAVPTPAGTGGDGAADKKKPVAAYQIKVATYHSPAEAQKAVADLGKKGFNVKVLQSKDKNGPAYVIQTPRYHTKAEAEKVAKKLRAANLGGQIQEVKP